MPISCVSVLRLFFILIFSFISAFFYAWSRSTLWVSDEHKNVSAAAAAAASAGQLTYIVKKCMLKLEARLGQCGANDASV